MDELLELVRDSNFYEWESVTSVLGSSSPRAARLFEHIRETEQMYWILIAKKCRLDAPPHELGALMQYELEQTAALGFRSSSFDAALRQADDCQHIDSVVLSTFGLARWSNRADPLGLDHYCFGD